RGSVRARSSDVRVAFVTAGRQRRDRHLRTAFAQIDDRDRGPCPERPDVTRRVPDVIEDDRVHHRIDRQVESADIAAATGWTDSARPAIPPTITRTSKPPATHFRWALNVWPS